MKKTLTLLGAGLSLALLALLTACDNKPDAASARERRPGYKVPAKVETWRWKQTDGGSRAYGVIVEQEGARLAAHLYTLEDGEGLVIREKQAQGKFHPDRKAIVFALYHPEAISAEKWIADGGPHLVMPWDPAATKVLATMVDPNRTNTLSFARLESVTPTYPATGAGVK